MKTYYFTHEIALEAHLRLKVQISLYEDHVTAILSLIHRLRQ